MTLRENGPRSKSAPPCVDARFFWRNPLPRGNPQGTKVGDDGYRVRMCQMVDVHRGLDGQIIWPHSLLESALALFLRKTLEPCKGGCLHGPVRGWVDGHNPDRGSLEPARTIEIAVRIPWSVTLRTLCDFFDQISPSLNCALLGGRGRTLPGRHRPGNYSSREQDQEKRDKPASNPHKTPISDWISTGPLPANIFNDSCRSTCYGWLKYRRRIPRCQSSHPRLPDFAHYWRQTAGVKPHAKSGLEALVGATRLY